jgi:hypothetical protein
MPQHLPENGMAGELWAASFDDATFQVIHTPLEIIVRSLLIVLSG